MYKQVVPVNNGPAQAVAPNYIVNFSGEMRVTVQEPQTGMKAHFQELQTKAHFQDLRTDIRSLDSQIAEMGSDIRDMKSMMGELRDEISELVKEIGVQHICRPKGRILT